MPAITRTRRMPPELRAAWVAALRSGKYMQGRKALLAMPDTQTREYCCLGVLCEVSGIGRFESPGVFVYRNPEYDHARGGAQWDDDGEVLTPEATLEDEELNGWLLRAFGLTSAQMGDFIRMNDDEKLSFDAIADHIEREL